jgi:prevent-host-death family protein
MRGSTPKRSSANEDDGVWAVAEAKARFREVIDRVLSQGPQVITRNGRKVAVIVSADEWERRTKRRGNLAEFLVASPLRGSRRRTRSTTVIRSDLGTSGSLADRRRARSRTGA